MFASFNTSGLSASTFLEMTIRYPLSFNDLLHQNRKHISEQVFITIFPRFATTLSNAVKNSWYSGIPIESCG